jgi:hypothetical protein
MNAEQNPTLAEDVSRQHPVREDMPFQRVFWIAERIAWTVLALLPVVALSGLFAHGALSERSVEGAPLKMEYERFQRQSALSRFTAHISPAGSQEIKLRLNASFQHAFEVESMQPTPLRSSANSDGLEFVYQAPAGGELVAVIWTRPRRFGPVDLQAETDGGGTVKFPVFVYP